MKRPALIMAALIMAMTAAVSAETRTTDDSAGDDARKLNELSKASQALYKKVSTSIVRVKLENAPGAAAPAQLLKEFEEWRQKQGPGAARRERPEKPERPDRRAHEEPAPALTMPSRPQGGAAPAFRRFLEQKIKEAPDAESQARFRAILARLENAPGRGQGAAQGPANETMAVVIDDQGHALLAWGPGGGINAREMAAATIHATTSDGTEVPAKLVGSHVGRGMAIIKLDSPGAATPLTLADGRPAGGEMLMCMNARQGSLGWIAAPGPNASARRPAVTRRATDERFPVFGSDERGATYLFNTNGELAAVGMDRFAVPVEVIKNDIQWIIKNSKDITPRRLGVKYDPVSPDMRKALPPLADKPAVLVKEVAPNSPADKAGLKKGDILITIDDVSVALFPQIQVDLATRHGTVTLEIIRNAQEKTLDMPLPEK